MDNAVIEELEIRSSIELNQICELIILSSVKRESMAACCDALTVNNDQQNDLAPSEITQKADVKHNK